MTQVERSQVQRWRGLLNSERDAAALYARLAATETGERRKIFEELAAIERRHASHWEDKIRTAGTEVPRPGRPSLRTSVIGLAARLFSTAAVLPLIERGERADAGMYDEEPDAAPGMAADERAMPALLPNSLMAADLIRSSRSHAGNPGTAPTAPAACGPQCSASATDWCPIRRW
jgi:hypothetical protein